MSSAFRIERSLMRTKESTVCVISVGTSTRKTTDSTTGLCFQPMGMQHHKNVSKSPCNWISYYIPCYLRPYRKNSISVSILKIRNCLRIMWRTLVWNRLGCCRYMAKYILKLYPSWLTNCLIRATHCCIWAIKIDLLYISISRAVAP